MTQANTLARRLFVRAGMAIAGVSFCTAALSAQGTSAAVLFRRATDREVALRAAGAPSASGVRSSITAYELVVRKYPRSGYCDNALWQASGVALLAYRQSNSEADRATAARLLRWLTSEYPSSPFAKQADDRLQAFAAPGSRVVSDATAPVANASPRSAAASLGTPNRGIDPSSKAPAVLRGLSREALPGGDRIVIEVDHEVAFTSDRIANPDRVFLDLEGTAVASGVSAAATMVKGMMVSAVRLGHPAAGTTRIVFDLAGAPRHSIYPLYNPYRLVIDAEGPVPAPLSTSVIQEPALNSLPASVPSLAVAPTTESASTVPPPAAVPAPAPAPAPHAPPPALPAIKVTPATEILAMAPPSMTKTGDYSLARQLGLGVQRIVIDAGHGGHDPGAQGNGVVEKDLVLDVALRLKKLLQTQPGIQVVLTRDTDEFIPLEERTAIANRAGADLFLSIHANASRRKEARGLETYFLNFATNPEAEAVAARENASSSQSMGHLPEILKAIALNAKLAESRELATMVQTSMVRRMKTQNSAVKDLGVKQAPFVVLIGAEMPSVLAEISFVTNKSEASALKQGATKQRIAQSLFDAIVKYQSSLKKVTTVAAKVSKQ
jgi:N-acetylmuramoyl-L-alanine amidase